MQEQILVIEDDAAVRGVIERALERAGYSVSTAPNGKEALDRRAVDAVRLVITDVQMPEMDGLEVLQHIRQQSPDLPVLVLTGGWAGFLEDATLFGANAVLQKPVILADLLATVRTLLDAHDQHH